MTGLDAASRAQALEDARRLRAEIESEARVAREIDRSERRSDALYAAAEADAERREWRHEAAEQQGIDRLEAAANDLLARPLYGALSCCQSSDNAADSLLPRIRIRVSLLARNYAHFPSTALKTIESVNEDSMCTGERFTHHAQRTREHEKESQKHAAETGTRETSVHELQTE